MPEPSAAALALRQLRRATGLSQEQLADRCQVSERTIRSLESGSARRPHRDTLAAVAHALGLGGDETDAFVASWRDERRLFDGWFLVRILERSMAQQFDRQRSVVRELSMVHAGVFDAQGRWERTFSRRTFEVIGDSVDEFVWASGHQLVHTDPARLRISYRLNVGEPHTFTIPGYGVQVFTAPLGRTYVRGEQFAVEYDVDVAGASHHDADPHATDDTEMVHAVSVPVQMLAMELRFDAARVPARVWLVASDALDGPQHDVRPLTVLDSGLVQAILSPAPVGAHGLRWEWD